MEYITLHNQVEIPIVGFGVFKVATNETATIVEQALANGYRSIDTAQRYFNEEGVGIGIKNSGVPRDEIFITSKVWHTDGGDHRAMDSIDGTLRRLQLDYIDLMLIHQPFGDYYGIYRALEKAYRQGKVRAIGISNFSPDRYLDLVHHSDIVPHVNQVETHVFNQQIEAQKIFDEYGTVTESWGPLAQGQQGFFENEILKEIGSTHNKSVAQVAMRYLIQRGIIVIPKTVKESRMRENIDLFDFELSNEEMDLILALDKEQTNQAPHTDPNRVKGLIGMK